MNRHDRAVHALVLGSFFLSGVAGLLYQVVWTRYLALFLGHTSYAVIAVLAAFMGGLALGNAWLGARADVVRRPLLLYAGLELGIGGFALLFPAYFRLIEAGFIGLVRAAEPAGTVRLSIQLVFAGAAILVPTVLMGATLPVLTRFVTRTLTELRSRVATLYAINSAGAVAGTVWADWWLIPGLGLEATLYLGAALSLGVGLVAWMTSRSTGEGLWVPVTREPVTVEASERFTRPQLRLALAGIGISGFVAMVYEVAWTRLLALSLGSSTHAYSLMLATFISGIAAGGWLVARWRRQANTLLAFGCAELALAATLFGSLWFYDLLPWWFVQLSESLSRNAGGFALHELFQALICFGVMFLPAVCLGTTLPLASRVATAELAVTGRAVGRVFAVNTLGTVLGAIVGGLVLLPWLGLARTFALGIALNALIGVMILQERIRWRPLAWLAPVMVLTVAWISATALTPRWQRAFALGIWRSGIAPASIDAYRAQLDNVDLRSYRDGAGSSVAIIANQHPAGAEQLSLRVNGKTDATSVGDMSTQVLMAHLPMLLRPHSREALVVGLGSGVTVGSFLRHPEVSHVDVVEISPDVVATTERFFNEVNGNALADPRVHLAVEDAKTFLKTTKRTYDVIATEPSNPWMAGVAGVFSREYYLDARARLKPGGLVAQWLQVYESNDQIVDIVINTFSSVFPSVGVWQVGQGDLVLIGSPEPMTPDVAGMARQFAQQGVREDLARVGIPSIGALLTLELIPQGHGAFVPETFPDTPIHSDFHPVLEYAAQRAFFERAGADKIAVLSETQQPRGRLLFRQLESPIQPATTHLQASAQMFRSTGIPEAQVIRSLMRRWLELETGNLDALRLLTDLYLEAPSPEAPAAVLSGRRDFQSARDQRDLPLLRELSLALLQVHRVRRSAFYIPPSTEQETVLRELIAHDPKLRRLHRAHLAEVLWDRGADVEFETLAAQVFSPESDQDGPIQFSTDPRAPAAVLLRSLLLDERRGDLRSATQRIRQAVERGLVGQSARMRDPLLEYETRRLLARALANPAASGLPSVPVPPPR
ncbi:MAG: hypothetical protein RIS76_3222 [Verrucomicrobiota bacterium]